jgi:hypothetical protein
MGKDRLAPGRHLARQYFDVEQPSLQPAIYHGQLGLGGPIRVAYRDKSAGTLCAPWIARKQLARASSYGREALALRQNPGRIRKHISRKISDPAKLTDEEDVTWLKKIVGKKMEPAIFDLRTKVQSDLWEQSCALTGYWQRVESEARKRSQKIRDKIEIIQLQKKEWAMQRIQENARYRPLPKSSALLPLLRRAPGRTMRYAALSTASSSAILRTTRTTAMVLFALLTS